MASTASLVVASSVAPTASRPPVVLHQAAGQANDSSTAGSSSTGSPTSTGATHLVAVKVKGVSNGNGNGNGNDSGKGSGSGGRVGTGKGTGNGTGSGSGSSSSSGRPSTIASHPGPSVVPTLSHPGVGDTKPVTAGGSTAAAPHQNVATAGVAPAHVVTRTVAAPRAQVVVNAPDPAPFTTASIAAMDASAHVFPTERLGPLSGIGFGGGLLIWPVLLAINVLALGAIARMALRRRLTSPGD